MSFVVRVVQALFIRFLTLALLFDRAVPAIGGLGHIALLGITLFINYQPIKGQYFTLTTGVTVTSRVIVKAWPLVFVLAMRGNEAGQAPGF